VLISIGEKMLHKFILSVFLVFLVISPINSSDEDPGLESSNVNSNERGSYQWQWPCCNGKYFSEPQPEMPWCPYPQCVECGITSYPANAIRDYLKTINIQDPHDDDITGLAWYIQEHGPEYLSEQGASHLTPEVIKYFYEEIR
jgi:hypothetical protein